MLGSCIICNKRTEKVIEMGGTGMVLRMPEGRLGLESGGSGGYKGRLRGPGLATQGRGTSTPGFRYPDLFL